MVDAIPRQLSMLVESGLWAPRDPAEWSLILDEIERQRVEGLTPELLKAAENVAKLRWRARALGSRGERVDLDSFSRTEIADLPATDRPGHTDLGLWNVFANPDRPEAQASLRLLLIGDDKPVPDEVLLPRTLALFKTPGLRGLAFSAPYLHNGSKDTLEDVIRFYRKTSAQARAGTLRNADPALAGIFLTEEDIAPLAAFLRALNEDYD